MSSVTEIERAIEGLAPGELERFRAWYAAFDAEKWDNQLKADVAVGALDALAAEAITEHEAWVPRRQGSC